MCQFMDSSYNVFIPYTLFHTDILYEIDSNVLWSTAQTKVARYDGIGFEEEHVWIKRKTLTCLCHLILLNIVSVVDNYIIVLFYS